MNGPALLHNSQLPTPDFWAHLCICTLGSYTSLCIRLSVRLGLWELHCAPTRGYRTIYCGPASQLWVCKLQVCQSVIARCQSASCMSTSHWRVYLLQHQVLLMSQMRLKFFSADFTPPEAWCKKSWWCQTPSSEDFLQEWIYYGNPISLSFIAGSLQSFMKNHDLQHSISER